jgi:hypothetical protein
MFFFADRDAQSWRWSFNHVQVKLWLIGHLGRAPVISA